LIEFHTLDVTSKQSAAAIAKWVQEKHGGLDVLVNNAGYATKGSEINEKIARDTIGCNYYGVKNVTSHLLPLIRQDGRIIVVSSSVGMIGDSYSAELRKRILDPEATEAEIDALSDEFITHVTTNTYKQNGWPASTYKVSKVLVNMYVRMLTRDYKSDPRKIFFASLCPGWVRTRMGGPNAAISEDEGADTPVYLATEELSDKFPNGSFWRKRAVSPW